MTKQEALSALSSAAVAEVVLNAKGSCDTARICRLVLGSDVYNSFNEKGQACLRAKARRSARKATGSLREDRSGSQAVFLPKTGTKVFHARGVLQNLLSATGHRLTYEEIDALQTLLDATKDAV